MSVTLTVGQINAAIAGLPVLYEALDDIISNKVTLSDAEVIAEDGLSVAALVDPALIPVLTVASALLPLAVSLVQSGAIKGDPNPIQDAQTTRNFDPGDPAARI